MSKLYRPFPRKQKYGTSELIINCTWRHIRRPLWQPNAMVSISIQVTDHFLQARRIAYIQFIVILRTPWKNRKLATWSNVRTRTIGQTSSENELFLSNLLWILDHDAWGCLYCVWKLSQEGANAVLPSFSQQPWKAGHVDLRVPALRRPVEGVLSSLF